MRPEFETGDKVMELNHDRYPLIFFCKIGTHPDDALGVMDAVAGNWRLGHLTQDAVCRLLVHFSLVARAWLGGVGGCSQWRRNVSHSLDDGSPVE